MITILCSGSRGDIQPYIALAVELKKQGRKVRIAAGQSFHDFISNYGIEHYSLLVDYQSVQIDPKLLEAARSSTNPLKMLFTFNKMKKYARMMVDEMYEACIGSELIIYHPGCTIGYFASIQMQIPSVMASPFPMLKTEEVASVISYGRGKLSKAMSYKLLQEMLWMASKTGVAEFWKEKFGHLPKPFACPFEQVDSLHPSIVSCSNYVFPRPGDWSMHVFQHGYWFLPEEPYTPSKELADFLAEGEKPIYFGFGSVFSDKESAFFISTIKKALADTGKRGILSGMGHPENLPPAMLAIDSVPHNWLFPKCSAVCHHGGAGTAAAGFAAGIPSIIVPFSNDQFAWAHRSFDLGVGSAPVYKKQFNAEKLKEAIMYTQSGQIVDNAKKLGKCISTENGAGDCAAVILELLK